VKFYNVGSLLLLRQSYKLLSRRLPLLCKNSAEQKSAQLVRPSVFWRYCYCFRFSGLIKSDGMIIFRSCLLTSSSIYRCLFGVGFTVLLLIRDHNNIIIVKRNAYLFSKHFSSIFNLRVLLRKMTKPKRQKQKNMGQQTFITTTVL